MDLLNSQNNQADISQEIDYDLHDTSIESAREVTKQCNGKRFRILMEIAKGCYGNCEGCSLSAIDRKDSSPAMSIDLIKKVFNYFTPIINAKKNIRTSVVNFGVGDYLILKDEFLDELFKETNNFFNTLSTPRNVITISTSLLLSSEKMNKKLAIMTKHLHPNQFAFDVVIDPFRLAKNRENYTKNLKDLNKFFPFFDIVINISDGLTIEHAHEIVSFVKENKVLNVDFQYAINNTNNYRVKIDQNKFDDFMAVVNDELGRDVVGLSISQPTNSTEGLITQEMDKQADDILNERYFVDDKGAIFPMAFAFGDIILDDRYGFKPIGHIDIPFNKVTAKAEILTYLKTLYLKNKVCQTCEFNTKCYGTGYGFYNAFTTDKKECQNLGLSIFKR
jgi:MoaA/NifB/PqqE/SkfB family radical SAM enzyme